MIETRNPGSVIRMLLIILMVVGLLGSLVGSVVAAPPYVYKFPKTPVDWGRAVSFTNLSPGFFQVMFQDEEGVVRIATYGIVGASMDKLKDPQLMMIFAFNEQQTAKQVFGKEQFVLNEN